MRMPPLGRNRREPSPDAIYLDYQATTPVDPRVLDCMVPFFSERFGNPHSTAHAFGHDAADAVEQARGQIAQVIGAEAREIVFTSGATESNNLAIKGAVRHLKERRDHVVTVASEHKCVLESVRDLERDGCRVTILPVETNGLIDPDRLRAAIDERTALVSVMAANNEIGVIQDLARIGAIAHSVGALFHTDAAQGFGKVPIDVAACRIDLLSISGHKIYAPKGIGALYVRYRPRVRLQPLFSGGGQERGLRSGTLAPALCVALGEAARLYGLEGAAEQDRLKDLSRHFLALLCDAVGPVGVNGDLDRRLTGNLNLSIDGVPALALIEALPDVALSAGSACTSAEVEPSYVLRALGLPFEQAVSSLRIGFGRFTTREQVERAARRMAEAVTEIRKGALP